MGAVNKKGEKIGNVKSDSANAVTWGVFPSAEIRQPTVVDFNTFMAWKDEAFSLWGEWSSIYAEGTESRKLIESISDTYYLVNIVDDNYVAGDLLNDVIGWASASLESISGIARKTSKDVTCIPEYS